MNLKLFKTLVNTISIGKQLPDAIYLHKDTMYQLPAELQHFIYDVAKALNLPSAEWNLIKLFRNEFRISLLNYPTFYSDSYPALEQSINIDLSKLSYKRTSYCASKNPPILHRKETMISPDSEHYQYFADLTKEGENAGLYDNTRTIGFRLSWLNVIKKNGYRLVDGRLLKSDDKLNDNHDTEIDRHKTAIVRHALSSPMKSLAKNGYLDGGFSIFDYGCGRGDDLRELEAHGLDVLGWDPAFLPDADKVCADIVNLGFVINVIEDRDERLDTLLDAWKLTKKILVVSVMVANESYTAQFRPYKDGVITSRNTFQKYYTQSEIKGYLERSLNEDVIAISPGIIYIFKDKIEEQKYLQCKYQRHHHWMQLSISKPNNKEEIGKLFITQHKSLFESFWRTCLDLGRIPANDEFEKTNELTNLTGSHKKAFSLLQEIFDINDFNKAAIARKEDLLLYFSMGLFQNRVSQSKLSESLKRDVKAFFGDIRTALSLSKELLFKIADTELIEQQCKNAYQQLPACILNENHSLIFHKNYIDMLPLALRVYVGAALQIYGELDESIDLIKIHITSGKLTLTHYDNFDNAVPFLEKRAKIKMATQEIDFFDYIDEFRRPPLINKHLLLAPLHEQYEKQKSFDNRLSKLLSIPADSEVLLQRYNFEEKLSLAGKKISNFRIISC